MVEGPARGSLGSALRRDPKTALAARGAKADRTTSVMAVDIVMSVEGEGT